MSDLILNWSSNATARALMEMVGISPPQSLERAHGPCQEHPLQGRFIDINSESSLGLPRIIETLGAISIQSAMDAEGHLHGLVFDATSIESIEELKRAYDFLHPRVRNLSRCGRVVVISRLPTEADSVNIAAARHALTGFTKSLAKELGRRGSTANMITLTEGAEIALEGPLRFLLSQRSAFVSGQTLHLSGGDTEQSWSQVLQGKTAVVTGAAQGIGEATARRFVDEGAHVILLDIPHEAQRLKRLADELNAVSLPLDITNPDAASQITEATVGAGVDILVHNAGVTRDKTLAKMSEDRWNLTLDVNLNSVRRVTRSLIDQGQLNAGGRVVFVSSIAGIAGNAGQTNYAASKAGVIGLTRAFSRQFKDHNIAFNAVAPGFIETRMTQAVPLGIRMFGRRLSNLNQGGLPEDIADAITFLSSPGAGGLHGNILRVCGGSLLGA